mmetsp:Transcript_16092/g.25041  ORF Transcript_16092/g.25041 Transcript_16092/m.25041 type:complete len:224 (+) Transcript_16092:595-1266(+)
MIASPPYNGSNRIGVFKPLEQCIRTWCFLPCFVVTRRIAARLPTLFSKAKDDCAGRPPMGRLIVPSFGSSVPPFKLFVYTNAMYDFCTLRKKNWLMSLACHSFDFAITKHPDVPRSSRCTKPLDPSGLRDDNFSTKFPSNRICSRLRIEERSLNFLDLAVLASFGFWDRTKPLGLLRIMKFSSLYNKSKDTACALGSVFVSICSEEQGKSAFAIVGYTLHVAE